MFNSFFEMIWTGLSFGQGANSGRNIGQKNFYFLCIFSSNLENFYEILNKFSKDLGNRKSLFETLLFKGLFLAR